LVKVIGANGFDVIDFHLVVPVKMFVSAYLLKMFEIFGFEREFANRKALYTTRKFKHARANIYEIPLKVIEELLVSFFEVTDITANYGITSKLNMKIVSMKSAHKVYFSMKSLLNEAV